jgi:hypothetical protein
MKPVFIVYAPRFDINSGGNVVLYDLARRLRERGFEVSIWIDQRPSFTLDYFKIIRWSPIRFFLRWLRFKRKGVYLPGGLEQTKRLNRSTDVVIYPEVTSNNPLGMRNVVRWILYFPGLLSKKPVYGSRDLFFLFSKDFSNEMVPSNAKVLSAPLINVELYTNHNDAERNQTLVLFRKGKDRDHSLHPMDAKCVDGKSHQELCELFNKSSRLYSYDLYTAYTVFAALCGCVPIVIPVDGVSEEQWRPNVEDRYGVAYGEGRIPFAVGTRDLLITRLKEHELSCASELEAFVSDVRANFFIH